MTHNNAPVGYLPAVSAHEVLQIYMHMYLLQVKSSFRLDQYWI